MHPTLRALWAFLGEGWEEEAPPWMQPGKGIRFVLIPCLAPEDIAFVHDLQAPHNALGRAIDSTEANPGGGCRSCPAALPEN